MGHVRGQLPVGQHQVALHSTLMGRFLSSVYVFDAWQSVAET